jgi:hypothetical protein
MLTRRNRDLLPQKTEPTPFSAKAKDLGALRDAVIDAASVGTGLWLSYLFVLFYFAIAAGAVTHRDLLLENPVKLPFLNVELPLKAFFILGPLVFLVVHAYVLLHFVLLAGKIGAFHLELQAQISGDDARARLRRQLPSNIFVQSLAGPREVRGGIIGFLLRRIVEISLVAGPIALLVLFQLQFLPHHSKWITSWQRIAVVIDLALLWILWPSIARGEIAPLAGKDLKRAKVLTWMLASTLPVLLVCAVATFPGEWLEENLPSLPLIPPNTGIVQSKYRDDWNQPKWISLHELLVAGDVNYVTGRPRSLWSNVLVLPNFELGDRVKFDALGRIAISSDTASLRGRSLEGAVLVHAHLRKADFTGAQLKGANFVGADLQEANFGCGRVGAESKCTDLQGAELTNAQLQGALLNGAQLQGAEFNGAQLQGAALDGAKLQGAHLGYDELAAWEGGMYFPGAQLQGATLDFAKLQGASFDGAELQGASLRAVSIWRTRPPWADDTRGAVISALEFDRSTEAHAASKSLIASPGATNAQNDDLTKAWADLEKSSLSAESNHKALAGILQEIGCAARGAPYVIAGLAKANFHQRFGSDLSQAAKVASAFLDERTCPGARGLSEEKKAQLQEIRDRGFPTSH